MPNLHPPPPNAGGHAIPYADASARVPTPSGEHFAEIFAHGSLAVEFYAPRGVDEQQTHARDEAYVVVRGSGEFVYGDRRTRFGPGDFLFVPAGVFHRFENFSADLAVWVMFYGPPGGEADPRS